MEQFTTHIKAKTGWFDIDIKELLKYKDLIYLFFKRNYATRYKQTILGPMWLILNPLITVTLYAFIFGNLAGLSTEGIPQFVFYLCSNALWTFFSSSLTQTSNTFTANAAIMGKVYFPRLVMPISSVITGMLDLVIQLGMLLVVMVGYAITGYHFNLGPTVLLAPVIIIQAGVLGLGCGIIIAALTTKYRDLVVLVGFGVQLWMYVTPVVYTVGLIPEKYMPLYMMNAMTPIMECWRCSMIGSGKFLWGYWGISWIITLVVLLIGIILFSKIEKTFMDTV
ncbi:ABC transporter permease [Butyrivibrio sp. INlla16]|uniref:ABC transporter permease n=1 Tax=Butyrivibrio sp. INlla16 TaxID=1520807 RepID=UPI0008870D96|nr:ABC transporter permease [Butyrivibrio sp. INlla16]SDB68212.1 lipopolysaccharide transport system permease protein [Butyrivibrio sp. INlla16]